MSAKHIPLRKCSGCGQMKPKDELIRLVLLCEGEGTCTKAQRLSLDESGKKQGRGAYLCKCQACFDKARKSKRFEKIFKCTIPEQIYQSMREQLLE